MQYGYVTSAEAYLAHHGIKGQKWGSRNGPPYPLRPGDHSAAERRKTGGHYSQGVKQDRGGSSGGGSSSSSKSKEQREQEERINKYVDTAKVLQEKKEKAEKAKKVAKKVAIGAAITAGVVGTGAVATAMTTTGAMTLGGLGIANHIAKHPEASKQALKNISDSVIGAVKNSSARSQINKTLTGEDRTTALNLLKNTAKADRMDRQGALEGAKFKDEMKRRFKENKKIYAANERQKALESLVKTDEFKKNVSENPNLFTDEVRKAVNKTGGSKAVNEMVSDIRTQQNAKKLISQQQETYRNTHGIRGAYNKATGTADKVLNFGTSNLNRYNKAFGLATGIAGAASATTGYVNNKKKEKERKRQQEARSMYY